MSSQNTKPLDPWTAAIRRGDFAAAWAISDQALQQRLAAGPSYHLPRHFQYVWRGSSLVGKRVLVRCYHGLGDTIQFIRFAVPLRAIAREVIVWVQPALLEVVSTAPGVDKAMPLHDGAPEADYDVDIEIMELPHALRATPDMIAPAGPYLFTNAAHLPRRGPPRRVGIVWRAGDWDDRRSIPSPALTKLAQAPDVEFLVLQRGAARSEAPAGWRDIGTDDLTQTAKTIRQLDLILSVDTMVAHLAGALGCPVWTLLHADCDWRWPEHAEHTPWYPSMRLFRQPGAGDWDSVLDHVRRRLASSADHPE
jgi:hypothetical protein